ncbi:outer membrane beta-barrel protein [Terrimonas pollutisoli]|uniref:outer membrane beta-barrel protein n=1 Tax=Terrimonas pollutisoli TaxID=3034147 RepID=UPI0023ECDC68|nr:outer membrane beta-barrel protein [Terrimonas sp. H1YJ31]
MKKIALFAFSCLLINSLFAQDSIVTRKKEPLSLAGRANDHFMIQLGYAGWAGKPDSINTGGFSKSFNVYFMFDFPFKTNPKLSMAFGPGISSDHIIFKDTYVGIKDATTTMQFRDQSDTNHFKKTKLNTTYLEAPVEFRYVANPFNSDKSFKFAIGAKVGTMINAHTRNKDLENKSGNTLNSYTMKETSKRFFNTTRLVGTARVGVGHFTLYGSYQLTTLFKEGVAAEIRPFSIGLTISGL